jgi:Tol biopolymer transport system component
MRLRERSIPWVVLTLLLTASLTPTTGLAKGKPGGGGGGGGGEPPADPEIAYVDCYYKGGRNRCDLHVMNADGSNDVTILKEAARGLQFEYLWGTGVSWSPDPWPNGRIAYNAAVDGEYALRVVDEDGSNSVPILLLPTGHSLGPAWAPTLAPDGNEWIAYSYKTGVSNDYDLFLISPSGGTPVNLTQTEGQHERHPAWSPQADRIAFILEDDVYVLTLGADGSVSSPVNVPIRDALGGVAIRKVDWCRTCASGDRLAVVAQPNPDLPVDLWLFDVDLGTAPPTLAGGVLLATDHGSPSWSPDDSHLACGGSGKIWSLDAATGTEQQLARPGGGPDWRRH